MAQKHIVKQGENLGRIARQYGFTDYSMIYNHPSNADFKKKRPNPDIICPGDCINIPTKTSGNSLGPTGKKNSYRVKASSREMLYIKLEDDDLIPWSNTKAILDVEGESLSVDIGKNGELEANIPIGAKKAVLRLFPNNYDPEPIYSFSLLLGNLDPIEEVSGIQARLNSLNFDCGEVDGKMGENTRRAVKYFQDQQGLVVDGIPGPNTQSSLMEVFGS